MRKALVLFVLLLLSANVYAASRITDIDLSEKTIRDNSNFRIEVIVKNPDSGMIIEFYVDNNLINAVNVGSSGDEYKSNTVDLKEDPLSCGTHTAKAVLLYKDSTSKVSELTMDFNVGNLPGISIDPQRPIVNKELKIKLTDPETDAPLIGVGIRILNKNKIDAAAVKGSTEIDGIYRYTPLNYGRYELTIDDKKYCGKIYFDAKHTLIVDGPHPENPVVGEMISLAVPMGVEVKVLDSEGDPYLFGFTTIGGGVNLTINKSGDYTLVIGDLSTRYWGINKSITVLGKPPAETKISPEKAVIGKSVSIDVSTRGSPLPDASVTIIKPDKSLDSFTTPSSGTVVFTPMILGEYNIMVEKQRYESVSRTMMVKNDLYIDLDPKLPAAGGNVNVLVKNQVGQVVAGVAVILDGNEAGITDVDGKFTLKLPEPKTYNITVSKKDIMYWDKDVIVTPAAELKVNSSRAEIRAGESTTLTVYDASGAKVDVELSATDPAGKTTQISGGKLTPEIPGVYTITAVKEGYGTTVKQITVNPREISVNWSTKGRNLVIAVSSRGQQLSNITVTFKEPINGTLLTAGDGSVTVPIKKQGNYTIEVNTIGKNPNYDVKTESRFVEKDHNLGTLIFLVLVILAVAAVIIAAINRGTGGGGGGGEKTIIKSKLPGKTTLQRA